MKDINIAGMGIVNLMILSTCVLAVMLGIIALIMLIRNWLEYKMKVEGAKYRKENGLFNIKIYVERMISAYVPRYQVNKGPNPETYHNDIPCINYFEPLSNFDKIEKDTGRRGAECIGTR